MIEKVVETKSFIFKAFSLLSHEEKSEIVRCWKNPFCARFNAVNEPTSSVEEIASLPEPTFSIIARNLEGWNDTNYFRAVFDKKTEEIIGVCRFGMCYEKQEKGIWEFGLFNVMMKQWGNGYGVKMLQEVCKLVKPEGIQYLYAGADNDNFGSYNAMIKSGFKYAGLDSDGDFSFRRDLTKPMPTNEEIDGEWQRHKRRYIRKFGKKRFDRLNKINNLIKEMLERIKAGENGDKLIEEYYYICNEIEEFPEKCEGE
ncbi:MAG: GNAT family N-acetyltransferase [Clostridia bacterium]|nr:GNAT family N-acetyltransferase [Clostridia bacterium]